MQNSKDNNNNCTMHLQCHNVSRTGEYRCYWSGCHAMAIECWRSFDGNDHRHGKRACRASKINSIRLTQGQRDARHYRMITGTKTLKAGPGVRTKQKPRPTAVFSTRLLSPKAGMFAAQNPRCPIVLMNCDAGL